MKNRKTIKMNYSEQSIIARTLALAQGVTPEQFDGHETWYYDETDNVKHLVLMPSKKVNAGENTCFVLGGIQAEDVITDYELHTALGKASGKEYQGKEIVIALDGEILEDSDKFPKNKLKLIDAWMEIHREDLEANWQLLSEGQRFFKIPPLQ